MKLDANTTLSKKETKELAPVTIQDSLFMDEDDDNSYRHYKVPGVRPGRPCHTINMGIDSYIWCFTGPRGAGKTTLMTLYAIKVYLLYHSRLISNYDVEFILKRHNRPLEHVKAEPLDLYKLLCFDQEYQDCLILLDEAPDVISHMAALTWKNRLLNIFVRQLRKNHNSLFMCAQNFEIIDKGFRWQTDVIVECMDASRKYGWSPTERGKLILGQFLDNSGLWTGTTYRDRIRKGLHPWSARFQHFPRVLWGEPGETKPVYNTYEIQDVWESLRRVDMKMSTTYQVGDRNKPEDPSTLAFIQKAIPVILQSIETGGEGVYTKGFYSQVGALTTKEKDALSKRLNDCGVAIGCDSKGKRYYNFNEFDLNKFQGT